MFHSIKRQIQRPLIFMTAILWVLSLYIVLHNEEIMVAAWQRKPVTTFDHVIKHAFVTMLDKNDYSPPSSSKVLENGAPLGPGNSNAPSIACLGMGRYQFRGDRLHLSTSDNTDPRTNGRHYEIVWPLPIPPFLRLTIFGLAIAVTINPH